jgi:hypothetical protein
MDNQTAEEWVVRITNQDKGTGVFAFAPPAQLPRLDWALDVKSAVHGPLTKGLLRNISYLNCVDLGSKVGVLAFKWIPDSVADFSSVETKARSCGTVMCVRRCASYGCICVAGECK